MPMLPLILRSVLAWCVVHPYESIVGLGAIVSMVNGALPAGVQRGVVGRVLHGVMDRLAVLSRSDARGTLKWPFVASELLDAASRSLPSIPADAVRLASPAPSRLIASGAVTLGASNAGASRAATPEELARLRGAVLDGPLPPHATLSALPPRLMGPSPSDFSGMETVVGSDPADEDAHASIVPPAPGVAHPAQVFAPRFDPSTRQDVTAEAAEARRDDSQRGSVDVRALLAIVVGLSVVLPLGVALCGCPAVREAALLATPGVPDHTGCREGAQRCAAADGGALPEVCSASGRWWPALARSADGTQRVCPAGCALSDAGVAYCAAESDGGVR